MATPPFLADVMLGSLATWLRILGCDVEYFREIGDDDLAERVAAGGRVLLTRDTLLARRRKVRDRCLLVTGNGLPEQLRQVAAAFPIDPGGPLFTRCARCNLPLERLPAEEAREKVPPYVARTRWRFLRCAGCGRVYWRGTHHPLAERRVAAMLRGASGA